METEDILKRLAQTRSDEEAWMALYVRMRPWVVATCKRFLYGASHLAEDASQEVFNRLVLYCPFENFDDVKRFKGYLSKICRNVVNDLLRAISKRAEVTLEESEVGRPQSETRFDEALQTARILSQISELLTEQDRELLRLIMEGFTPREIAKTIGITPGNASVRIYRLRTRLRTEIFPSLLQDEIE